VAAPAAHGRLAPSPLSACFQWQSISLDMSPADQPQALALLLALCARSGSIGTVEEIRKELQERTALKPEKLSDEVALFAIETPGVYRAVASLGVSSQGLSCGDAGRFRVCVMVLYPASAAAEVARVRASLARALSAEGVAALLAAKNSKEALDVLLRTSCGTCG